MCVIDQSWRMEGEKIKLIKDSFNFLLEFLGNNDRLSIVIFQNFAYRISRLIRTTAENKIKLQELINYITH